MSLPETYKAVICPAANAPFEIVTRRIEPPAPNSVLIRVHASGICFSDHFAASGTWPGLTYPRTPGHEVVGRVARVGAQVAEEDQEEGRFKEGALVGVGWNGGYCGKCEFCRDGEYWTCKKGGVTGFTFDGGHAEYMYAPASAIVALPESLLENATYAEIAPLFCGGLTVYDAIHTSKWNPGDICLVQGIGGLGHFAIQYASKLGLKVYALSTSASKRDLALSLGAHAHIDGSKTDAVKLIQELGGAKLVLCTAPYAKEISNILPAVAKNGTITLVSAAVDAPIEVSNVLLNMNRATLRGWCCGAAPDAVGCVRFSGDRGIKSMVQTYSLEEFTTAYDGVMANKARFRNVIVFP